MNEKSPQWVTVTAEHEGREVQGLYALDGEMLIVSYGIHSKTRQLVGMAASALARVLLLEIAKGGKPLYGATTALEASAYPGTGAELSPAQ
jgi:hypothetical protein